MTAPRPSDATRRILTPAALFAAAAFFVPAPARAENKDGKTPPPQATQPAKDPAKDKQPEKAPDKPKIDEEFALAFYKERLPEAYSFVTVVKQKDPKTYDEKIKKEIIEDTKRLMDLKARKPEYFEPTIKDNRLTFRCAQLAKDLRTPDPGLKEADLARMRAELTDLVTQNFAVRQELRKLQMADQQRKVDEWRRRVEESAKQIEEREKDKANIVTKYVDNLLNPKPTKSDL